MIQESGATGQVVDLYLGLKALGIPVVLRHYDGKQFADIALPDQLYVKVKGPCSQGRNQITSDLFGNIESGGRRLITVLISHSTLENPVTFELALKEIAKICRKLVKKKVVTGMKFSFSPTQWQ